MEIVRSPPTVTKRDLRRVRPPLEHSCISQKLFTLQPSWKQDFFKQKILDRIAQLPIFDDTPDKDTRRISKCLTDMVCLQIEAHIHTKDIEKLICETAATLDSVDFRYGEVAVCLELESYYKEAVGRFSTAMKRASHLLSREFLAIVKRNAQQIDEMIDQQLDWNLDYPALCSLKRSFLMHKDSKLIERPQHLWMRVSIQLHGSDMKAVKTTYRQLATGRWIPSPNIISGCGKPSLFRTLSDMHTLSSLGGSVAVGLQDVPAKDLASRPMQAGLENVLRLFNAGAEVADPTELSNGVTTAVYIETWHAEIYQYLNLKRDPTSTTGGKLIFGLLVNDIFMRRVEANGTWTMFCPSIAQRLSALWGQDFEDEYTYLETRGLGTATVLARDLWWEIVNTQLACGGPSLVFKDTINAKSNEQHLGTITQSSIAGEIAQANTQDGQTTTSCPFATICLPSFISKDGFFDFDKLEEVTRSVVVSLNRLIANSAFANAELKNSIQRTRSIGIGVQGLADAFAELRIPFSSTEATKLNRAISETIYYIAVDESCNLTPVFGVYPAFEGSPASKGVLQPDMWDDFRPSGRHDWDLLRNKVKKGMVNSSVTAYMQTSGISLITDSTPGFDPFLSLLDTKPTTTCRCTSVPRHLVEALEAIELWDDEIRNLILRNNGSIQDIDIIPEEIRELYKTAWEIDPMSVVEMAVARGPFVCQSQSVTVFLDEPQSARLSPLLFYAWKAGLKTGLFRVKIRNTLSSKMVPFPVEGYHTESESDSSSGDGSSAMSSHELKEREDESDEM